MESSGDQKTSHGGSRDDRALYMGAALQRQLVTSFCRLSCVKSSPSRTLPPASSPLRFSFISGYLVCTNRFSTPIRPCSNVSLVQMAARIIARRVTSQLPKLRSASQEQAISDRGFASAAKAQDESTSVEVGRSTNSNKGQSERAVAKQQQGGQERAVANRAGWAGSSFPSLFSPLFNLPSSFMRPTSLLQMMDTVDHLFSSLDTPTSTVAKTRIPWDVMEDDKCFKLRMDLPGMSKQDVKIAVEDGDLVVKAEHEAQDDGDEWSGRSYGVYNVRIKLPENVDLNGIKAEMKDGVLKIKAPKVEGVKQKHEVQIE